jgi:hypothetical protein
MRWARHVNTYGERRGAHRFSVGDTGGKETTLKTQVEMKG